MTQGSTDTGPTVAAVGRRGHTRGSARPADWERVDVEWSLLKPSGVVGDEREHAETDLVALNQNSAGNHDEGDWNNRNFSNKSLRHLPRSGRQLSWF